MVHIPFSVYLGWITIATIANVTALLVDINWNAFGLGEPFWAIAVIIVGIDAFTAIPFALLRKQNKALKFATIKIINVVVNISLNFLFLLFIPAVYEKTGNAFLSKIFNPELGVGYVFVSNLIASLCTLLLLSGEIFRVTLKFSRRLWFEMIIYSFPLLISGLAGTINEALDRVLLKHLITAETDPLEQVGIYGANYKIAVLMQLFIQMFRFAAEPFYFARAKDKNARILYADIMKYFVIACMLIFLVVTLYIDLFKHFIGSAFHEGLHIVPVVLYAIFLLGIFFNLSIWYKLNNLTKYGAIITLIGSLVTFFVNWLFIPRFGYTASAWGHFFCYMIMVVISWLLCRKYFYIPYDLKKIIFYSLLPVVIFVLTVLLDPNSDVMKWIINTFFIAVYIAIVIAFERSNLLELFRSKP